MNIQSKVQQIVGLAMEIVANKKAHVFADYSGHVNMINIDAHPVDSVYKEGVKRERVIERIIFLTPNEYRTEQHILQELDAVIAQLNELKAQRKVK